MVAVALAVVVSADNNTKILGFNSGNTFPDRSPKVKKDWLAEIKTAQTLENSPGFNALRLFSCLQADSDSPIEAFEAAVETQTKLLLGIWASGTTNINKEVEALRKTVDKYGSKFTDLVVGVSVGSEDVYRQSELGIKNKAGVGNSADSIMSFIKDFRSKMATTALAQIPVGHVDTWDAWSNTSSKALIETVDWIGMDDYAFYEDRKPNEIRNAGVLFDQAYAEVLKVAGGKPVWATETGWPVSGPDWGQAVASVQNAKYYWNEVGCRRLFNKVPTFWYTLRDSNPANQLKFAVSKDLATKPAYDLTCPNKFETKDDANTSGIINAATANGVPKPVAASCQGNNCVPVPGRSGAMPAIIRSMTNMVIITAIASGVIIV